MTSPAQQITSFARIDKERFLPIIFGSLSLSLSLSLSQTCFTFHLFTLKQDCCKILSNSKFERHNDADLQTSVFAMSPDSEGVGSNPDRKSYANDFSTFNYLLQH